MPRDGAGCHEMGPHPAKAGCHAMGAAGCHAMGPAGCPELGPAGAAGYDVVLGRRSAEMPTRRTTRKPPGARRVATATYRELFEANPHPMWVYDLETLAFLAVNDAAIRHYGYSRAGFLSMRITDIRPDEELPKLPAV